MALFSTERFKVRSIIEAGDVNVIQDLKFDRKGNESILKESVGIVHQISLSFD